MLLQTLFTWVCILGLFILNADPQWVPSLASSADNPHCLLLILGHGTPHLVRERSELALWDFGWGHWVSVFSIILTFWDFFFWKLMSSIARIRSLCALSSENHYKQFIFWLSRNWTDPDSDISSVYQPVIVGYSSTLEVQQLTGVNLASVPWVLSAGGSCVCHVNNVIAGHGQRSVWAGGEGHVDTYVEGVSGWWLTALQLLKQHLIVCTDTG